MRSYALWEINEGPMRCDQCSPDMQGAKHISMGMDDSCVASKKIDRSKKHVSLDLESMVKR